VLTFASNATKHGTKSADESDETLAPERHRSQSASVYRSPLSPWPEFTFFFAFLRRSADNGFPTSSDSLNLPAAPRRTGSVL